jgi:hypothetical protein
MEKEFLEQLISFETAKLVKKCDIIFSHRTNNFMNDTLPYLEDGTRRIDFTYNGEYFPAPTQSMVQQYLRKKHKISVEVNYKIFAVKSCNGWYYSFMDLKKQSRIGYIENGKDLFTAFKSYEAALEVGLQEAVKFIFFNVKQHKNEKHG